MTDLPRRDRWMEPGAAPYQPPAPAKPTSNVGRAVGLLAISPCLIGLIVASRSAGPGGAGGAVLLILLTLARLPKASSKS